MVGLFPKKNKKNKTYYVRMLNYSFSMYKLDENGKRIPQCNQVTGQPITLPTGEPAFVSETVNFKPWKTKFSDTGYVCVYEVNSETPKLIADELAKDAASRTSSVLDEDAFIKSTNPDLYEQMKADIEAAKVIGEKEATISSQAAEIERLKERLQKQGK